MPQFHTELEDGMRRVESSVGNQGADGGIFVEALPVLPSAKAVIETLRLFGREVAICWLSNAHMRILAASAFSKHFVAQTPGLAN
jgi:hypothetical protein